ncbi:MAG TPA: hypothetical protein VJI15_05310 [Candidatus Nanoarchaeia archaeon]|nr:hypothetical protein [Candidatus Nanoarchaeia archaeon]
MDDFTQLLAPRTLQSWERIQQVAEPYTTAVAGISLDVRVDFIDADGSSSSSSSKDFLDMEATNALSHALGHRALVAPAAPIPTEGTREEYKRILNFYIQLFNQVGHFASASRDTYSVAMARALPGVASTMQLHELCTTFMDYVGERDKDVGIRLTSISIIGQTVEKAKAHAFSWAIGDEMDETDYTSRNMGTQELLLLDLAPSSYMLWLAMSECGYSPQKAFHSLRDIPLTDALTLLERRSGELIVSPGDFFYEPYAERTGLRDFLESLHPEREEIMQGLLRQHLSGQYGSLVDRALRIPAIVQEAYSLLRQGHVASIVQVADALQGVNIQQELQATFGKYLPGFSASLERPLKS